MLSPPPPPPPPVLPFTALLMVWEWKIPDIGYRVPGQCPFPPSLHVQGQKRGQGSGDVARSERLTQLPYPSLPPSFPPSAMYMEGDWLYVPGDEEATPCRWLINIYHCRESNVYVAGYYCTIVSAGLTFFLLLIAFFRYRVYRVLAYHPRDWSPFFLFCLLYGLGVACLITHCVLILADPVSVLWERGLLRALAFLGIFSGIVPHILQLINLVYQLDHTHVFPGQIPRMSPQSARLIAFSIIPFSAIAGILHTFAFVQIDQGHPEAYKALFSVGCILYIQPCMVIGWFYREYGVRYALTMEQFQDKERGNLISSMPSWNLKSLTFPSPGPSSSPITTTTTSTSSSSSSPSLHSSNGRPEIAPMVVLLQRMQPMYPATIAATSWTSLVMVIMAVLPDGIYEIPALSIILFFASPVSASLSLLAALAFMTIRAILEYASYVWDDAEGHHSPPKPSMMNDSSDQASPHPSPPQSWDTASHSTMAYHTVGSSFSFSSSFSPSLPRRSTSASTHPQHTLPTLPSRSPSSSSFFSFSPSQLIRSASSASQGPLPSLPPRSSSSSSFPLRRSSSIPVGPVNSIFPSNLPTPLRPPSLTPSPCTIPPQAI
ncbi:MAG: hypothetical protein DHS80DRAFT_24179 [Piptocephalis tieghemiana]|nr:MAG: hypothetical protein DHS80DRAFT_24179 [Piptocephalis tieghemiana]